MAAAAAQGESHSEDTGSRELMVRCSLMERMEAELEMVPLDRIQHELKLLLLDAVACDEVRKAINEIG